MTDPTPTTDDLDTALDKDRVLAIVRYRTGGGVLDAVDAICAAGIRVVEVTTSTPGWLGVVAGAAGHGHLVGAGTVLTAAQVHDTAAAGGRFVVSPGLDDDVVRACRDTGLEAVPGVLTPTDIQRALRLGVRWLKLFPAGALGTAYLQQLRGPFADVRFVPTGGITLASVPDWLRSGAAAVALGSEVAGREAPADSEALANLGRRAREAMQAAARG